MATPPSDDNTTIGGLIRLSGLQRSQLPPADSTPASLVPLLTSLLREAVPFIDSVAPKKSSGSGSGAGASAAGSSSPWKILTTKRHADSAAGIDLLERTVVKVKGKGSEKEKEKWICRRSVHEESSEAGRRTASWAEFRESFKERHPETEDAFTPEVVGARRAVEWDCGVVVVKLTALPDDNNDETYGHFSLAVVEMRHHIGKPLKDRTFPVLQMTCAVMEKKPPAISTPDDEHHLESQWEWHEKPEILIVSVTVSDFGTAPEALLSKDAPGNDTVIGAYASIERIRKLPPQSDNGGGGDIEWIMATASDAGGVLPKWVQAMAVPGQIAKDVYLFLSWIAKEREKQK
ncbi:hypothetical protein B0T17DRAFT_522716 [Bombardia bombarda]|uniref:DUF3074 domain-containing protein n=1 Tax=Bombardia bombarda TaxID=252184 RepID=A0AA40C8F9_9PEZI|nr:hypothetical protein B0T17DRAFT_522716 [Bombardia bombarda]